jgi:hypothetical protein
MRPSTWAWGRRRASRTAGSGSGWLAMNTWKRCPRGSAKASCAPRRVGPLPAADRPGRPPASRHRQGPGPQARRPRRPGGAARRRPGRAAMPARAGPGSRPGRGLRSRTRWRAGGCRRRCRRRRRGGAGGVSPDQDRLPAGRFGQATKRHRQHLPVSWRCWPRRCQAATPHQRLPGAVAAVQPDDQRVEPEAALVGV